MRVCSLRVRSVFRLLGTVSGGPALPEDPRGCRLLVMGCLPQHCCSGARKRQGDGRHLQLRAHPRGARVPPPLLGKEEPWLRGGLRAMQEPAEIVPRSRKTETWLGRVGSMRWVAGLLPTWAGRESSGSSIYFAQPLHVQYQVQLSAVSVVPPGCGNHAGISQGIAVGITLGMDARITAGVTA